MRPVPALVALAAAAAALGPLATGAAAVDAPNENDPSVTGFFEPVFEESGPACVTEDRSGDGSTLYDAVLDRANAARCKPAGSSMVQLPSGNVLYWDSLESEEDIQANIVLEFGELAQNNYTRLLDLGENLRGEPTWTTPTPEDGGANPNGNPGDEMLPGVPVSDANQNNDGDMFCSDQIFLPDGRVLVVGGTSYYSEPGVEEVGLGVIELEGLKNSRIYTEETNSWDQSGSMEFGRWYPSLVTMGDGSIFAASGVTKLIKPVYPDRPSDSGTNVRQVESYDVDSGTWETLPESANNDLPLYPRLHLLPNGNVYYDAAGQAFNPAGQSVGQATWNLASSFDPDTNEWTDIGIPVSGGPPPLSDAPGGFRGSAFSQMLPLEQDENGNYTSASFLSAGGVRAAVVAGSPGAYLGLDTAAINTVDTSGESDVFTSRGTGSLNAPRWYGTGVTLPNGEVIAFSGADVDEVVAPGTGVPERTPELWNPETGEWRELADASQGRTYHNNATLMQDGRILVGGHSPIATLYSRQMQIPGKSEPTRDPTFEIFNPPYLFYGERPEIVSAPTEIVPNGETFQVTMADATDVEQVRLVRNSAQTHVVDSDQRTVDLPIVARDGDVLTVQSPPDNNVSPAGPYMLFANKRYEQGLTPSVSQQVFVPQLDPAAVPAPMPPAEQPAPAPAPSTEQSTSAQSGNVQSGSAQPSSSTTQAAGSRELARTGGTGPLAGLVAVGAALVLGSARIRDGARGLWSARRSDAGAGGA